MALVKAGLKTAISAIQKAPPPSTVIAATQWSAAIFAYSSTAMGGVTIPTLVVASLQSSFLASMNGQTWMDDLGTNLLNWWAVAPWVGPAFTGVTLPPSPLDSTALGVRIMDGEDPATVLSNAIDQWTKTVKVTLTNTSSGATSTAPVI